MVRQSCKSHPDPSPYCKVCPTGYLVCAKMPASQMCYVRPLQADKHKCDLLGTQDTHCQRRSVAMHGSMLPVPLQLHHVIDVSYSAVCKPHEVGRRLKCKCCQRKAMQKLAGIL